MIKRVGVVLLGATLGCVQELVVVRPAGDADVRLDGGRPDVLTVDVGSADARPDVGRADAAVDAGGLADARNPDAGIAPPDASVFESCTTTVELATLCLTEREGFAGADVSLSVTVLVPAECEGVGRQSGALMAEGDFFTLLNPESEGCTLRAQDGDLITWSQRTQEDDPSCSPLYSEGVQDILRFRIAAETPPGIYPLPWLTTFIQEAPTPSSCSGELSIDGTIRVR